MFQRLDKLRKNAFGSVLLFGSNNDSSISGIWIFRGQDLAFTVSINTVYHQPSRMNKLDQVAIRVCVCLKHLEVQQLSETEHYLTDSDLELVADSGG